MFLNLVSWLWCLLLCYVCGFDLLCVFAQVAVCCFIVVFIFADWCVCVVVMVLVLFSFLLLLHLVSLDLVFMVLATGFSSEWFGVVV